MIRSETKIGYSLALLDIAKEEKKIKEIYKQVNIIFSNLDDEPEFVKILDSSSLDNNEKFNIIDKTFKGFHWSLVNTMKLLAETNRVKILKDILTHLIKQLQELLNIKKGIIYSTIKLSRNEIKKIEDKLTQQFDTEINLVNLIDKELIGGFKVELGSFIIDESIRYELQSISKIIMEEIKKGGV